jgi:hypothetical protein
MVTVTTVLRPASGLDVVSNASFAVWAKALVAQSSAAAAPKMIFAIVSWSSIAYASARPYTRVLMLSLLVFKSARSCVRRGREMGRYLRWPGRSHSPSTLEAGAVCRAQSRAVAPKRPRGGAGCLDALR